MSRVRPASDGGAQPEGTGRRRGGRSGAAVPGPRQVSLARLKEFDITPRRDLGQNFLVDDNILSVITGQLESTSADVVLEVGAGLGVLTGALARVAGHVHAFEVDKRLETPLAATLRGDPRVSLHFRDILKFRLEELDPAPTLCASNLPYSVAGPFLIEALQRLPGVRRYCVMMQREVAERLTATPGGKDYGVLSVWVGLYARVGRVRPLSRSIFYPVPRVDSSLVVLDRLPPDRLPACDPVQLRATIQAAFGQRRKTLANALSAGSSMSREQVANLLVSLGHSPDVRAERLTPDQFAALAGRLGAEAPAAAKPERSGRGPAV